MQRQRARGAGDGQRGPRTFPCGGVHSVLEQLHFVKPFLMNSMARMKGALAVLVVLLAFWVQAGFSREVPAVPFNLWNNVEPATDVEVFWHNPTTKTEVHMGTVAPGEIFRQNSYRNHLFLLRDGKARNRLLRPVVVWYEDHEEEEFKANTEKIHPMMGNNEVEFKKKYEEENGRKWIAVYPRGKPVHYMHPPIPLGEERLLESKFLKAEALNFSLPVLQHIPPEISDEQEPLRIKMTQLSERPRLFSFEDFLSDDECDHIIALLSEKGGLERSTTGDKVKNPIRTSSTRWIDLNETPVIDHILHRVFEVMKIPYDPKTDWKLIEKPQALHYAPGQQYKSHHDYFLPTQSDAIHSLELQKGRNRFATFFIYLSDVEEGGETSFPDAIPLEKEKSLEGEERIGKLQRFSTPGGNEACLDNGSLKVKPKKGKAVLWYSMLEDGNLDEYSLHSACPVVSGEKYAMNLWFWDPRRDD